MQMSSETYANTDEEAMGMRDTEMTFKEHIEEKFKHNTKTSQT